MSRGHTSGQLSQQNAMPGPDDTTRIQLDNGLTVVVRENHAAPVTVIDGFLRGGALLDPPNKAGLASFVAGLLTRGSQGYDFDSFNEAVEGVGASLIVGADNHTIGFGTTSLSEDFPTLLTILADTLRRPTFPDVHIQRMRNQKLIRIQERDSDTQSAANQRFFELLYPDHPYGRSTLGYGDSIVNISRDDLVAFHEAHFTPQDGTIVVVGDVETDQVVEAIEKQFGDWQGLPTQLDLPPLPPLDAIRTESIEIKDKIQSDIMIGVPVPPRDHPDFFPLRLANTILGRFGMMGRLGEVVREQLGLAYYVYSSHEAGPHAGIWYAAAGVNAANVSQAIDAIQAQFQLLADEPASQAELDDSQAYLTGVLPLQLETNDGVAATLASIERNYLGLDYLQHYNDLIYSVTLADIQRVAQAYLRRDAYVCVTAGPGKD